MESISNLYNDPDSDPVGHVFSFIGAKGGVGSSTICHNVPGHFGVLKRCRLLPTSIWLSERLASISTRTLCRASPKPSAPERLDEVLLDRLLTKCSEHLSIFAAPVVLDRDYEICRRKPAT
jgi:pilus assembly protein CpaE